MQWKLAKDELPKKTGTYFCMDLKYGCKKVLHYTYCEGGHGKNSLFKRRPHDIEWLDFSNNIVSDCRP